MLTPHEQKLLLAILAIFLIGGLVRWYRKSQERFPAAAPIEAGSREGD